jgi:ABC-type dipeptide/oligopeptide/nickel transport system ATPase component
MERDGFLELRGVASRYGATQVLTDIDLSIAKGEFVALLGSSGCGKTTLLRLLAGFISPSAGEVKVRHRDVTYLPPDKRGMALVFQSYALWPHMTVAQNIGYGLKLKGISRPEIATRVAAITVAAWPRRAGGTQTVGAVRRSAPACRARPGARHRSGNLAARRAAVQPRRPYPPDCAPRAAGAAEAPRHHRDPRHPRPRGGHGDGRPDRHPQCRQDRPTGHAGRCL